MAVNGSDNYIYNSEFKDNEAIKGGAFYLEGGSTVIENPISLIIKRLKVVQVLSMEKIV